MNPTRWLWRSIAAVSVLGTVLLAAGFAYAIKTVVAPSGSIAPPERPAAASPLAGEASVEIVALGDSLTVGYGDDTGKGYVRGLQERLKARTAAEAHVVANFARNGYTAEEVLADVREREGVRQAIRLADVVVLTAGGNDLMSVMEDEVDPEAFVSRIPRTEEALVGILAAIRELNPEAHVYYVGLYNPFLEWTAVEGTTEAVASWNDAAFRAVAPDPRATFVPTFDLFEADPKRFLSADGYHPNAEGYARIADRLAKLME